MASSGFLKKLRNRITKKKSYDIETPCSANHGTILLRRYDRVPSTYGDSFNDRQNILRDFVPPVQKQHSPGGRFRGEVTLPRHFRLKSGHHRTQSNVSVTDNDDIDLYNAIGDHRRSSCSCTCTTPRKVMSPVTPTSSATFHLTQQNVHSTTPQSAHSTPPGKGRNAAKDPLPPIVKDIQKEEIEEQERLKQQAVLEEAPRYTGIDDYSSVDFDQNAVPIPPNATLRPRAHQPVNEQQQALRACMTLPPSSRKQQAQAPKVHPHRTSDIPVQTVKGQPKGRTSNVPDRTSKVQEPRVRTSKAQEPRDRKAQEPVDEVDCSQLPQASTSRLDHPTKSTAQRQQCTETKAGFMDVLDCYHEHKTKISLQSSDLPIPHESCINKDRKAAQPIQCDRVEPRHSPSLADSPILMSCSAPSQSFHHPNTTLSSIDDSRHYPQNTSHHEYKEAHQVLRATSLGKINSLLDLELSSSVEDLYAHVPKGTSKTPDMSDMEADLSDQNTDNEDSLPPPPIPSRNYRNTDSCCPMAAQLGGGSCTCSSNLKDLETGEDLQTDGGPESPVIHQQPKSNRSADGDIPPQVVEPIHMTLEEVWQDACARGIPMEKPSTMTLHRRHKSTTSTLPTNSPPITDRQQQNQDGNNSGLEDSTEDCSSVNGAKKKEKFKLKNIFKKTDHDSPSKSPMPGHRRTLSTPAGVIASEDTCSDSLNTSGEMSSTSELSESLGNTSNCSSADSGVDEGTGGTLSVPEPTRTINADFIESLRKLKDCGWYWGPLSWDGAEARLDNKPDGSFLVRDSSDDRYILSISFRSQGTTHHTRIEHYKGTFSFFSQPKSHGAGTIIEFIEKAMEHSRSGKFLYFLRPRAPGFPPAPVQLLYPVSRFRVMQSLQHMCRFEILRATRYDHIDELPLPKKVKSYLRESQYYTEYILEYDGGDFMQL